MLGYCLFCGQAFSPDDRAESLRPGVRIAFDPERGRIWAVCDRCHGWNLWPLEDRLPALYSLERSASRARLLYRTENIALLEAPGLELIRVGVTELPEEVTEVIEVVEEREPDGFDLLPSADRYQLPAFLDDDESVN